MRDGSGLYPLLEAGTEPVVGEVDRPDGRVRLIHLGEAGVQAEQAHEARPLALEVGDGEDRSFVRAEAREHVVRVLQPAALADSRRSPDAIR